METKEHLKLTNVQICDVVRDWYTNGMYADILQTKGGSDLEELLEPVEDEIIGKLKLTTEQVWDIVLDWYDGIYEGPALKDETGMELDDICQLRKQSEPGEAHIRNLFSELHRKQDEINVIERSIEEKFTELLNTKGLIKGNDGMMDWSGIKYPLKIRGFDIYLNTFSENKERPLFEEVRVFVSCNEYLKSGRLSSRVSQRNFCIKDVDIEFSLMTELDYKKYRIKKNKK